MKSFGKGFISGMVVLTLVFSGIGYAAVKSQKIDVLLNTVKLSINDKFVSGENIIYKNKLYIPADKVSTSLGKTLTWDKKTNSVSINDPIIKSKYHINSPAPVGTSQSVKIESASYKYTADVVVDEIIRGDKAWEMILSANQFNDEAPAGKEYIIAKVSFKLNEIADGKSLTLDSFDFKCYSSKNKKYDTKSVVSPEPEMYTQLYSGASHTGLVIFLIDTDDLSPKMGYGQNYDGTGGIWLSLSETVK